MNIDFSNLPDKTEPQNAIDFSGLPDNDDNGVWGGLIKPTIKAVPRVIGHTVASMAQAPISGIAAGAKLITSKGDLNAANKVLEENQKALDDFYLTTDEERQGSQNIGLAMKPFQMAGKGWREIGKVTGIPYAEPILGTIGEASAVFGLGGAAKSVKGRVGKAFEGVRDIAKESKGDFSIKPDIDFSKLPDKEIPQSISQEPNVGTLEAMVKGGKTGEPPKYAGDSNINLERLDTTNDVKHFADGLAKQAGIEKTKQSWAETEKLAQELGWDEKEFLRAAKKKGGFDTAETYAMRQINANAIHNVFKTIREMPADPLQRTDAMRLQAVDAVNNYIEIAKAYTEKTSEAGRSLNIYKKLIAENPDFIQNKSREAAFKKMFDSNGGKKLTDAMIDDLQKTDFNNPLEVRKILQKYHKATLKDKLFEAWLNGILSNPTTHMANVIGNALTMVTKVPETTIAGITRGKIPFGEVKAESVGMVQGIKDGATAAVKAFQSGMPSDMVSKIEHNRYTAISGTKGKIIRIPTRALTAADEFFKAVVYRSEVNRLAYLKAIKDGAKGKNLSTKMAEIINDPTKNMDIFAAARNEALYRTFQQPLGHFANKVMSVRDSWYPAKFIIPFIKTPVNIAKFTLERTPLNYAKIIHDFRNGKITTEQLSYELAKPTLGSLISAATVMYVLDGTITGGAPKNKKERELLYATGWQPYSIKIGNKYYSYSRLEPIGSIFGLTADFVNTVKNSSEKTINETSAEVLMSVTKNLSSKTFLSGISKVLDAISDPEHYGATYIEQLAGSLVPSGVAAVARSTDPYVREVESPIEAMQARIPILSQRLPYREGAYQVPIENTGGIMNMISPVKISQENDFKDMAERDIELLRAKRIIEKEKRSVKKEISREKRTN